MEMVDQLVGTGYRSDRDALQLNKTTPDHHLNDIIGVVISPRSHFSSITEGKCHFLCDILNN